MVRCVTASPADRRLARLEGHVASEVFSYLSADEHGLRDGWWPDLVEQRVLLDAAWRGVAGVKATEQVVWLAADIISEGTLRLSWAVARGRPGACVTTSVVWNYGTLHQAEEELLGKVLPQETASDDRDRQRLDGLSAWCEHGSRDPSVLERAGVHDAEQVLLSELAVLAG